MRNRYVLTLLHWISTVLLGAILSSILGYLSDTNVGDFSSATDQLLGVALLCVVFAGGFSLPLFLISLWLIPRLLKRSNNYTKRFLAFSGLSLVFVLGGYFFVMSWLSDELFSSYGYVLVGYFMGTVVSSIIWTRVYKPAKEEVLELDTLDHHLTRE